MKINSLKRSHNILEIQPISILKHLRDNNGKIKARKPQVIELQPNIRNAIKPLSSLENDIVLTFNQGTIMKSNNYNIIL